MKLEQVIRLAAETGARAALAALDASGQGALRQTVDEIVAKAAKESVRAIERERAAIRRRESRKASDNRLYNTRLLLKNYRQLKAHFENAVYEFEEEETGAPSPGEIWDIMNAASGSEEVYIESIRRSSMRTMIIIRHIEKILSLYEIYCANGNMESLQRQYRILRMRYLDEQPLPMTEIAEREHVSRRTAERDLDAAIKDVTALLFGVDAVMQTEGKRL